MSTADCRTRLYLTQTKSRPSAPAEAVDSYFGNRPARIFEHRRSPWTRLQSDPRDLTTHVATTNITYPLDFDEIEQWLGGLVDAELGSTGAGIDQSSSMALLFLDEKSCIKTFKDGFDMSKLHSRLRIHDWCTAHYMSTFCRFPLPLEVEIDDVKHQGNYNWDWRYTISHPFDWDMIWVYLPSTRTSVGIARSWFEGYDKDFLDMESLITDFAGSSLSHPMLLGLFALQSLTRDCMGNVREKGNRLYEAQKQTGFHTYDRLRSTDLGGDKGYPTDLAIITKDVLGAASHITGWDNASQQLIEFGKFLMSENKRFSAAFFEPDDRTSDRLRSYIDQQSEKQIQDLRGALCDSRAWLATASFLMQGVLNLISQRDANVNIELARDSKRIAEDAKRDSMSMRAIAIVTMFFLPGTFTASFFALPFFSLTIQDEGMASFWIYWAVTIPLMVLVLIAWLLWLRHMRRMTDSGKRIYVST